MKWKILNQAIDKNMKLYINGREIQVLEKFSLFNICEINYLDTNERTVVDILGITQEKIYNNFISLHRLKRSE